MKCFSIDLDGTLLNSKHEISSGNLKVLEDLQKQKYTIIFNTGRAFEDVIKYDQIRRFETPIFSINGTVLYSKSREILYEASIPVSTYQQLLPILKDLGLWTMVYTNQGGFPCRYPSLAGKSEEEIQAIFEQYPYDEILQKENLKIYKVMAVSQEDQTDKIARAKQIISEQFQITIASSYPNNVELTSLEATKGKALLRYQQMNHVTFDEIFAFGDGGNDLSQFRVATTAVAMANAPSYIQKEANIVTKSNDEDGFAYAVKQLLHVL